MFTGTLAPTILQHSTPTKNHWQSPRTAWTTQSNRWLCLHQRSISYPSCFAWCFVWYAPRKIACNCVGDARPKFLTVRNRWTHNRWTWLRKPIQAPHPPAMLNRQLTLARVKRADLASTSSGFLVTQRASSHYFLRSKQSTTANLVTCRLHCKEQFTTIGSKQPTKTNIISI